MIPRYTGFDPDGIANTEADHLGNCPVCGTLLDMRDLDQMPPHLHDAEIETGEGTCPPGAGRISFTRNTGPEFDSPRSLENEKRGRQLRRPLQNGGRL